MRGRFNTRQRNYIILGLCSILLVMAAGYAAFRTQLTINGTSNITSEFKVLITDIQSRNVVGRAENAEEPSHTETTATFKTNLYLPGDSITYDVTVENQGSIDAVLKTIQKSDSNNNAIIFETSGIQEGEVLKASESTKFSVTVSYNASTTSQPSNITSDLEVTLNYEQATGEELPVGNTALIGGNTVSVADSGDGLYSDDTRAGRYVYRGSNPDNYIEFNDELWRIVAKEADGTYKIVRNEVLPEQMPFDEQGYRDSGSNGAGGTYCANSSDGCNAWAATANLVGSPAEFTNTTQSGTVLLDSSLNKYLNGEYYNSLSSEAQGLIVSHDWSVGAVFTAASREDGDIYPSEFVAEENAYIWNGKVALLSPSDAYLATGNQNLCGTSNGYYDNMETCSALNYLIPDSGYYWLVSPLYYGSRYVSGVSPGVNFNNSYYARLSQGVRPAVFLSSSLSFSGSGTQSDPYRIN